MAYVKYTEKIGVLLISNYFDIEKIRGRLIELNNDADIQPPKSVSLLKIIFTVTLWLILGLTITFMYKKYV
jgi:hypothetical protein